MAGLAVFLGRIFFIFFSTVLFGRLFNSFLGYTCKQFPNKHSDGQPLTITEECGIPCVIVPPRVEWAILLYRKAELSSYIGRQVHQAIASNHSYHGHTLHCWKSCIHDIFGSLHKIKDTTHLYWEKTFTIALLNSHQWIWKHGWVDTAEEKLQRLEDNNWLFCTVYTRLYCTQKKMTIGSV